MPHCNNLYFLLCKSDLVAFLPLIIVHLTG